MSASAGILRDLYGAPRSPTLLDETVEFNFPNLSSRLYPGIPKFKLTASYGIPNCEKFAKLQFASAMDQQAFYTNCRDSLCKAFKIRCFTLPESEKGGGHRSVATALGIEALGEGNSMSKVVAGFRETLEKVKVAYQVKENAVAAAPAAAKEEKKV